MTTLPAHPGKLDLGFAMALEQARAALSDPQRLLGIYLGPGRECQGGGRQVASTLTEVLIVPAAGPGLETAGRLAWQVRKQPGSGPQRTNAAGRPFSKAEFVAAGEAVTRLQALLASIAAAQDPSPARLLLASRTGGTLIEMSARTVKRSSLEPHEAAALLAETGAMRQAPALPANPGPSHAPAQPLAPGSLLRPDEAGELLKAIGIVGPSGSVLRDERRKYNQINHLLELLRGLLERLPRDREMVIVDAGCGKSQLLFVLNHVLTEKMGRRAHLIGLDTDPDAVETARRLLRQVGYRNMEFLATPIRAWKPPPHVDLVLSLHACDTATDEALALGVATRAQGIVAVPCCQHELAPQLQGPEPLAPLLAQPVMRSRLADVLTDGLRALVLEAHGYSVDVLEYISPLDTPKNILLRAELGGGAGNTGAAAVRAQRAAEAEALMGHFGVKPSLPALIETIVASRRRDGQGPAPSTATR